VVVGPLDEDGAAVWVLDVLYKGILVFAQHMLIHRPCMTLSATPPPYMKHSDVAVNQSGVLHERYSRLI
jgi:hypothetical protein